MFSYVLTNVGRGNAHAAFLRTSDPLEEGSNWDSTRSPSLAPRGEGTVKIWVEAGTLREELFRNTRPDHPTVLEVRFEDDAGYWWTQTAGPDGHLGPPQRART